MKKGDIFLCKDINGQIMARREILLYELCKRLGLEIVSEEDHILDGLNLCNRKSAHDNIISYVVNEDYIDVVRENKAIKVLVLKKDNIADYSFENINRKLSYIVHSFPERCFYDIHEYLYDKTDFYYKYEFEKQIGSNCIIHPSAVIEEGVVIGDNNIIGANTVIKRGTVIKSNCEIGCNSTIGSEGFQIIKDNGKNRKVKNVGGVLIENDTSIGDNVCICNSLFEDTTHIGKNVKIDNLCYIGHNVIIGNESVITSCVSLCGSVVIESGAWIGANSTVLNRIRIGNGSMIGIGSVATRNISNEMLAYGAPAREKGEVHGKR